MEFIDLRAQQSRIRDELQRRMDKVLAHGRYIMGPEVAELESRLAEYVGVDHCVTCANGTDALQLALLAKGIGPGDVVFTSAMSFVASAEEREGVREERLDMDINASAQSRKAPGMEAGADFMLIGSINSIVDRQGSERVVFYQVNLELVDMVNNRKVWIGDKKIKKHVQRARYGF